MIGTVQAALEAEAVAGCGRRGRQARKRGLPASAGRRWRRPTVLSAGAAGAALALTLGLAGCARRPAIELPAVPAQIDAQLSDYLGPFLERARAAKAEPDRHAELGLVYEANGYWSEARQAFANAVALAPDEPLPRLHHAIASQAIGDAAVALEDLAALTRRRPEFAPGHQRLALARLEVGDLDGAETALSQAVALAPQDAAVQVAHADLDLRRGRPADAARRLETVLAANPDDGAARHLLGLAYRGLGRRAEAERELRRAHGPGRLPAMADAWSEKLAEHARTLQMQMQWAEDRLASGRTDDAIAILDRALQWNPNNINVMSNLATAWIQRGDLARAGGLLRQALAIAPADHGLHSSLAAVLYLGGDVEAALASVDRALAVAPAVANLHRKRAAYLARLGRADEAAATAGRAVELDPQNGSGRQQLAMLLAAIGRKDAACEELRVAAELLPGDEAVAGRRDAACRPEAGRAPGT